jgi:hypothetical protein
MCSSLKIFMLNAEWSQMVEEMMGNELPSGMAGLSSLALSDPGLFELLGSLQGLAGSMNNASSLVTTPSTGQNSTAAFVGGSSQMSAEASAEAASRMAEALFTGANNPFAAFSSPATRSSANQAAASSMLRSFLGGTSSSLLLPTSNNLFNILGSSSGPFAALLQPLAAWHQSRQQVLQQMKTAIQQADALIQAPNLDDLFGGALTHACCSLLHECNPSQGRCRCLPAWLTCR